MTEFLLTVEDLRVAYGHIPVLFGIDLDIRAGEVVALLGANGAGKTTTLRTISGLLRPTSGSITFDGRRIDNLAAERIARLGLVHVPEGRGVFPSLLVEETLRLAGRSLPRGDVGATLDRVYELFPRLHERRRQPVGQLSGGERQMVAVSRALLSRPKLLMIDEPSQGLAPVVVDQLFEVIETLAAEDGIAVLLVEQFVTRALAMAQRAFVLTKGEVTYAGTAKKLAADEAFIASSYLGEVDDRAFAATLAEETGDLAPPRIDPERVPLVAELPAELREALADLAAERAVAPERLIADLVNEARRR